MENIVTEKEPFAPKSQPGEIKMKNPSQETELKAIGKKQIDEAIQILKKYKEGKINLEKKIIANEQWWKLRHWEQVRKEDEPFIPATAWLWNVIVSKHADMEDGYPIPNFLPREEGRSGNAFINCSCSI